MLLILLFTALIAYAEGACVLYQGGLANGFTDVSGNWAPHHNICDTKIRHNNKCSLSATLGQWDGIQLRKKTMPKLKNYSSLSFWINGGSAGGQKLSAGISVDSAKNA